MLPSPCCRRRRVRGMSHPTPPRGPRSSSSSKSWYSQPCSAAADPSQRPRVSRMRLSTVILPVRRWQDGGRDAWVRAEQLGFHAAYTYDHLSWRSLRDHAWSGAIPTLTAAAAAAARHDGDISQASFTHYMLTCGNSRTAAHNGQPRHRWRLSRQ
ncbi:exported protein of unknown function [Streptomyces murinus]